MALLSEGARFQAYLRFNLPCLDQQKVHCPWLSVSIQRTQWRKCTACHTYPAAITSSNNASTAAWPLLSLTCMSVAAR